MNRVDDVADPRIADYRNVPDAELLERRGIFVAEGRLVVRRLLTSSRMHARSVMVTDAACASIADVLSLSPDLPVYLVPQAVMNTITGFNMHRGCLAIGERPPLRPWCDVIADARRVVVLERVANADNVGSVFRNAAAFGVDAVVLDTSSTDPLYRKAIRTSMGAALSMPYARVDRLPASLQVLRDNAVTTIALIPDPAAPPLADVIADAGQRVAIVLGHEGDGLGRETIEACAVAARIPMAPGIDSLNVATAAAVALYELTR